jgi:hypothetical protein
MSFGRRSQSSSTTTSSLSQLTPTFRRNLNRNQTLIQQLTNQLVRPPQAETRRIQSYQNTFFDKLRNAINQSADASYSKTQSDLAKRFGGSLASTFGTDLLSRLEKNRLGAIEDARTEAELVGQQLFQEAEQSRIRKLQALQNQFSQLASALRDTDLMRQVLSRQQSENRSGGLLNILGRVARFSIPFFR